MGQGEQKHLLYVCFNARTWVQKDCCFVFPTSFLSYLFTRCHKLVQPIITWSQLIFEVEKNIFVNLWWKCLIDCNISAVVNASNPHQDHGFAHQSSVLSGSSNCQAICALQNLILSLLLAICMRKNWGLWWLHRLGGLKRAVAFSLLCP